MRWFWSGVIVIMLAAMIVLQVYMGDEAERGQSLLFVDRDIHQGGGTVLDAYERHLKDVLAPQLLARRASTARG